MYKCIKNIQGNPLKKEQCTILLSAENQSYDGIYWLIQLINISILLG